MAIDIGNPAGIEVNSRGLSDKRKPPENANQVIPTLKGSNKLRPIQGQNYFASCSEGVALGYSLSRLRRELDESKVTTI